VNAVLLRPDFVFPLSIVQGRLVIYIWTQAVSTSTAGSGWQHEMADAEAAPMHMMRWASCVKHSHAKDTAVCPNALDDGDCDVPEQP